MNKGARGKEEPGKMGENIIVSIDKFDEAKNYWLEKLSGEPGEIKLVTDFPYTKHYKPANYKTNLNKEESRKIIQVAKHKNLSLYIIMLTIFKIMLHKYTGQEDIIVSSPVYNVSAQEYNKFVVLRDSIDSQLTFKELLMKVKQTVVDGYTNQFYPIEKIIELLGVVGIGSMSFFRVILQLEDIHDKEHVNDILTDCENYFVLCLSKRDQELDVDVQYNLELFRRDTIVRLVERYQYILKQVSADTSVKIDDIELITADEKLKIMEDFNNTRAGYPSDKTIHRLFEEQVEQAAAKIAAVYGYEQLAYNGLNERANQLARELRKKGVGAGTIIGIMVERSLEMIVGLLGILKSGGAYLPIDPGYPVERIKYMLSDCNVKLLLTQPPMQDKFPFEGELINLEEESSYLSEPSNLENINTPKDFAYVIFTSGSTGKPKGVLIRHHSIVNTLHWRKNYYSFNENDRVLQIPSFAFDSSVEDIFTPLISGSKLVLIREQQRFNLEYLSAVIKRNRVTHFLIVPNLYKNFLQEIPGSLLGVKTITVAGENFTEKLVKEHYKKLNNVELYNEYGPTENSVCTTVYKFSPEETKVLIGKPINNVKCYLLDKKKKLMPPGVPGELCISGIGLAKSYLNRPQLTAEKFVDNPFASGEPMYRTGDLARWMPAGNLEFIGRIDQQVKIRGFRIELGEIEHQLLKHKDINETVVRAKTSDDQENPEQHIYAYFTSNKELTVPQLKTHLAAGLPDYMMPSHFVKIEKIPLTANGKVDANRLETYNNNVDTGVQYVAPGSNTEERIAAAWKEVLKIESIGVLDNFFDVGGHSLSIIRVNSLLKKDFQKEISVVEMFSYPTIRSLAQYLVTEEKDFIGEETIKRSLSVMEESARLMLGE